MREKIVTSVELIQTIRAAYRLGSENVARKFATLRDHRYVVPFSTESGLMSVDHVKIKVMGSISCPIVIPFVKHTHEDGEQEHEEIIDVSVVDTRGKPLDQQTIFGLWKPADIRKEAYVMNVIRMMKRVLLEDEGLDLPILPYKILPCSPKDGLIQMISDCVSNNEVTLH